MNNNKSQKTSDSKQKFTLLLILICVVGVLGAKVAFEKMREAKMKQSRIAARSKGNAASDLHIIEHIDFQCPACAFGSKMLKEYFDKYPDKMFVEMRYHPLTMHTHSFLSARYAECAARQGKFWPFQDSLVERQTEWSPLLNPVPVFEDIAKKAGVDLPTLNSCISDPEVDKLIKEELDQGTALGVRSTPAYFVNGNMLVGANNLKNVFDQRFPQPASTSQPAPQSAPATGGTAK